MYYRVSIESVDTTADRRFTWMAEVRAYLRQRYGGQVPKKEGRVYGTVRGRKVVVGFKYKGDEICIRRVNEWTVDYNEL